jgi:predicted amidohydrolase
MRPGHRHVRITAVQLPTIVQGRSFRAKQRRNRLTIAQMLRRAGERRSDLVLFGEYANLHHRAWSRNKREYVPDPIPGSFTRMVSRLARQYRMNVALPMFGRYGGVLSSWVIILDRRGAIAGAYQKSHPTLGEQQTGITAGNDIPVFTLDFGRVGIMTCMDIEYPEVALVLMLRGAEMLLFPHVQATWGETDWEVRYRARAVDTGLYVVSACYGYDEGEWLPGKMIGRTSVVGRDGLIMGDLGRQIGLLTLDLDLEGKRETEFFFDRKLDRTLAVMASRRPELYGDLIDQGTRQAALRRLGPGSGPRRGSRARGS